MLHNINSCGYYTAKTGFEQAFRQRENSGLPGTRYYVEEGFPFLYMMHNPGVQFIFNDVPYSIHLADCSVFPQGYASLVPMMDNNKKYNDLRQFTGTVMMADIGNGTMNIMRLVDGRLSEQHCWTEVLGVNQSMLWSNSTITDWLSSLLVFCCYSNIYCSSMSYDASKAIDKQIDRRYNVHIITHYKQCC